MVGKPPTNADGAEFVGHVGKLRKKSLCRHCLFGGYYHLWMGQNLLQDMGTVFCKFQCNPNPIGQSSVKQRLTHLKHT